MAKKVTAVVKLQIPAGKANPAPPVGSALGPHGINIMGFCKEFNEKTNNQAGSFIPADLTLFEDRTVTVILKTPPAPVLLKKAAGLEKASDNPLRNKVGSVTREQVREIATLKMPDLNASDVEAAMRMIEGTARSMGITVSE